MKKLFVFFALFILLPFSVNAEETTYVAQIGENLYENWDDVLANVEENDYVSLLRNVDKGVIIQVDEGMSFTLSLNNYEVCGTILNNGKLNINGPGSISGVIDNSSILQITGYLDIKSGTAEKVIYNGSTGNIVIDYATFIGEDSRSMDHFIENKGTATVRNSNMDNIDISLALNYGNFTISGGNYSSSSSIFFTNYGTLTIDNGNFKTYIQNYDTLIINDGTFSDNGKYVLFGNSNGGNMTINGGNFTNDSFGIVSSGYSDNVLKINGGTFNVSSKPVFAFSNTSSNSTITINGGIINSDSDTYVISDTGSNNTIKITGGTINSKQAGILLGTNAQLIIGIKDGIIEKDLLLIDISNSNFFSSGNGSGSRIVFYDGTIKLNGIIAENTNISLLVPAHCDRIKHDKNDDGSYTVYLVGNNTTDDGTNDTDNEESNTDSENTDNNNTGNDNTNTDSGNVGNDDSNISSGNTSDDGTNPDDDINTDDIIIDNNDVKVDEDGNQYVEVTPNEPCEEDKKPVDQSKEETVKNPETGLFNNYGVVVGSIVVLGTIGYFVIRKRSKFPQA